MAAAFAAEGAFVCLTARSEDALQATADQCRKEGAAGVAVHPCNLADGAEVRVFGCLEGATAAARDYHCCKGLLLLQGRVQSSMPHACVVSVQFAS